jgi:glycosyltransferase involved in cell wall biosynthesis
MPPQLSFVVLTLNEARNIGACLASIAAQDERRTEVVVVDAASDDGTVDIVRAMQASFPVPLRLEAAGTRLPIGAARNLGVRLAQAPHVAFLSADAELEPRWAREALASLRGHAMVFGPQLHAPHVRTVAAAVRGLRYHFPEAGTHNPLPYASNVAAAYRREVLERFPFDPQANAAEDLLLALRAARAGHAAHYNPRMRVRHHDVATLRQEWRKSVREGEGCATYSSELGLQWPVLAWGAALAAGAVAAAVRPRWGLPLLGAVLYGPAARRAARRRRHMAASDIAKGVAATPPFDLAYLATYLRALGRRRRRAAAAPAAAQARAIPPAPQETHG